MKVMVTGAAGMLGREVTAACHGRGHEVVALARPALDVTDATAVDAAIVEYEPDAVVNCAAFSDIDAAEEDEAAAMRVNDQGAALLAGSSVADLDSRMEASLLGRNVSLSRGDGLPKTLRMIVGDNAEIKIP